jgi:hypothetical protein
MKTMRKCNDEIYTLVKDQALVKKLKNKRFRPFCLCPPPYEKDALARESTLCVAGALIG